MSLEIGALRRWCQTIENFDLFRIYLGIMEM